MVGTCHTVGPLGWESVCECANHLCVCVCGVHVCKEIGRAKTLISKDTRNKT